MSILMLETMQESMKLRDMRVHDAIEYVSHHYDKELLRQEWQGRWSDGGKILITIGHFHTGLIAKGDAFASEHFVMPNL